MKRYHAFALVAGAALVAGCGEPTTQPMAFSSMTPSLAFSEFATPGNHVHVMPTQANYANANARPGGGGGGGGGTGIFYHGGPGILSPSVGALYWANSTIYAGGAAVN